MSIAIIAWIVFAVILLVIEAVTVNLVTIWVAVGAIFAAIVAIWFDPVAQWSVFVLVSGVLVAATRPLAKKLAPKTVPLNYDRVIGQPGVVIEGIDPVSGKGQVKVMGQIWSAKCADCTAVSIDASVKIVAVEGVKVIVELM